ncbi:Putative SET domain-containing protein [Colletotrichum destructivum]|uniref:SET domain-containing protein n=1 Tax=Colletotrichum destructivum TaxID=34406 RepID=A0AAX4J065_9PEZI|nr:Putative SET domain-containing protein [Colletotrichum destructivum]
MAASQLPLETLFTWAMFNNVDLVDVEAREIPGCGLGLISNKDLSRDEETLDTSSLLRIPHELVLSAEAVENYAKVDKNFRQLLDAAGHKSTRHDICLYLLTQKVLSERLKTSLQGGVSTPWTEYVKYLPPRVPVPTLWTEQERDMLQGTSLESATAAKIVALTDEFDGLRETSSTLTFWNELFWESEKISLIDWVRVDAWFRSRCLELPKSGEAMVPVLDLANHSSEANAYYEENGKDEVVLLLRPGCRVSSGEEMTISYGDAKSGAEMLFSYGFIDPVSAADRMTLPLMPLEDDPLGKAKLHIFKGPPTVEFVRTNGSFSWESPFAYIMCLNEEDGLLFRVLQDTDGSRELRLFWQEEDVTATTTSFDQHINGHPLAQIFRLRVVTILQDLAVAQLERLNIAAPLEHLDESKNEGGLVNKACISAASTLRGQETVLLETAVEALEEQKTQLLADENVVAYLGSMEDTQNDLAEEESSNDEEDFS